MTDIGQNAVCSFTFYTYIYGDDPKKCARQFYASVEEARQDLAALRAMLIGEEDRNEPLQDMKIVLLETVPVTANALVELFNNLDGDLGGFIRSRKIVDVVTEPQFAARTGVNVSGTGAMP